MCKLIKCVVLFSTQSMTIEDRVELSMMLVKRHEETHLLAMIHPVDTDVWKLIDRPNDPYWDTCIKKALCNLRITCVCPHQLMICAS